MSDDLRERFDQAQESMLHLRQGTDDIRTVMADTGFVIPSFRLLHHLFLIQSN